MASLDPKDAPKFPNTADLTTILGDIFARVALVRWLEGEATTADVAALSEPEVDESRVELVHPADVTIEEWQTLGAEGHFDRELLRIKKLAEKTDGLLDPPQLDIFDYERQS